MPFIAVMLIVVLFVSLVGLLWLLVDIMWDWKDGRI